MRRWGARAVLAAVLATGPQATATAGEVQDRVFRVGLLQEVATGESLVFSRTRSGSLMSEAVPAIDRGAIEVSLLAGEAGRAARIELRTGDRPTSRSMAAADGGHPVLLVFLETTVRSMSALTGGSPFYIRNRIREALAADLPLEPVEIALDGVAAPAQTVRFLPFADDPNRARMGALADLAITIMLSDAAPGGFARFEAVAGDDAQGRPAYRDIIAFAGMAAE